MATCPVSIYQPSNANDRRCAVLYMHGGGLVYGERDDLPSPYVRSFVEAGYTLICADYPLAPETPLPGIIDALYDTWRDEIAGEIERGRYDTYTLFGRSAGAYLAFMLAREIRRRDEGLPQPRAILDFYGYYDLTEPWLSAPAAAYSSLPPVDEAQVAQIVKRTKEVPTSGSKALRYALYVYARQHEGAWLALMGLDGSSDLLAPAAWSLSSKDIELLPPLFIAASTGDEDVPYRVSKQLSRRAPRTLMRNVYYLPHDFDRDVTNPAGEQAYQAALGWLSELA